MSTLKRIFFELLDRLFRITPDEATDLCFLHPHAISMSLSHPLSPSAAFRSVKFTRFPPLMSPITRETRAQECCPPSCQPYPAPLTGRESFLSFPLDPVPVAAHGKKFPEF